MSILTTILQYLLKLSSGNKNTGMFRVDNSVKNWRNLPISNPKPDLYNINVHIKFVEIHWNFLKLSSGNENMDDRIYDRRMDGCTDVQHEIIIPCHYCVAGYKKNQYFLVEKVKISILFGVK